MSGHLHFVEKPLRVKVSESACSKDQSIYSTWVVCSKDTVGDRWDCYGFMRVRYRLSKSGKIYRLRSIRERPGLVNGVTISEG